MESAAPAEVEGGGAGEVQEHPQGNFCPRRRISFCPRRRIKSSLSEPTQTFHLFQGVVNAPIPGKFKAMLDKALASQACPEVSLQGTGIFLF